MQYDIVKNYAMKCRLYPTATQKRAIDDALTAVRVFHNCLVYDMWNKGVNLREVPKKDKDGKVVEGEFIHFPDLRAALTKPYKDRLIAEHPVIEKCPQAALTTNVGLKADLTKEFGKKPVEYQKPTFYTELHPRRSYSYQEPLSKIEWGENDKVFHINLSLIGKVKLRGWNQKLRFGDESTNFLQWAVQNPSTKITVVVSKDVVGDYFLVFKIKECLKPFPRPTEKQIGIDVGIADIAICSDGRKYENRKFKKQEKRHQRLLNRKLSRRWGPSNEVYRAERKKNRMERKRYLDNPESFSGPEPPPIQPSKQYLRTKKRHAQLNRKIARKRDLWNHEISRQLVEDNSVIAVETLNISGMVRNRHLSYALTDAGFGTLLQFIKYKAEWHCRTVLTIDQWTPSSKRCSACGYIYDHTDQYHLKPWNLAIRKWTCPVCGCGHDRDINAAENILFYAKEQSAD